MSLARSVGGGAARIIGVALGVALLSWLLVEASPGSTPERAARAAGVLPADDSAIPGPHRARLIEQVTTELELDGSAGARVVRRVAGVLRFDFGRSWTDGGSVAARVADATPRTLLLVGIALVLAVLFGLAIAVAAARREGTTLDLTLGVATAVVVSLPVVWLSILLARTFAAGRPWQWFPVEGLAGGGVVLPIVAMATVPAFVLGRHARAAVLEQLRAPWATAARARGVPETRIASVHALRASASALLPLLVMFVAYLLAASVVVERVFGIRGLGALLLDASARGDAPTVVAASVVTAVVIACASVATDVARRRLDPREAS